MRLIRWLIAMAVIAGIGWLFPLFHVVSLKKATAEKAALTFDVTHFAETFWTNQLLTSLDKAVPVKTLLPAIQNNPAAAKKQFARTIGLSDGYYYFVSGTGRVVAVSDDEVSLATEDGSTNIDVVLETGLVFGNTVRDATGLLNVNDYVNSQDFNDISAALNHLVETRVLPKLLTQAKVGAKIHFTGGVEIDDESSDLKPLKIIPVQTDVP